MSDQVCTVSCSPRMFRGSVYSVNSGGCMARPTTRGMNELEVAGVHIHVLGVWPGKKADPITEDLARKYKC